MISNQTSILKAIQDSINNDEPCKHTHESAMCDNFMGVLSRLDIGHNRVVRYIFANELYILLKYGPLELKRHRNNNHWWG